MKLTTLIIIMALLSLIWGAGFILMPSFFWSLYGLALDAGGVYMSRQLGVVFFMLGLILWLARKEQSPVVLLAMTIGLFSGNVLGFVVALIGQFSAGISMLGWVGIASYFLLAFGFGYYLVRPVVSDVRALQAQ
jgi:hypothetical protein